MDDGEDILIDADAVFLFEAVVSDRLFRPAGSAINREYQTLFRSRQSHQIVEDHHDVATQVVLDIEHLGGGEVVFAAVDVAAKHDPFVVGFGDVAETESLETAAVGQKAAIVSGKTVQAPHLRHRMVTGAQVEMVGIGQDDLRI